MSSIATGVTDAAVVNALMQGGVGVIPTDTIYGIVCRASDPGAVKRLFTVKLREQKPGTVIAASTDQLIELGLTARYVRAVEQYWPGALSVVIPCSTLGYLHRGVGSLAVRVPDNPQLLVLLEQTGPLMTTSANQPGQPAALSASAAEKIFGSALDFYVEVGELPSAIPSTVIRIVDDSIEILRQGAVNIDENGRIQI